MTYLTPAVTGTFSGTVADGRVGPGVEFPAVSVGDIIIACHPPGGSLGLGGSSDIPHMNWDSYYGGPSNIITVTDVDAVFGPSLAYCYYGTNPAMAVVISGAAVIDVTFHRSDAWDARDGASPYGNFYWPYALDSPPVDEYRPMRLIGVVAFESSPNPDVNLLTAGGDILATMTYPIAEGSSTYVNVAIIDAGEFTMHDRNLDPSIPPTFYDVPPPRTTGSYDTYVLQGGLGTLPTDPDNSAPVGSGVFPI
jgi:hypothetical protein